MKSNSHSTLSLGRGCRKRFAKCLISFRNFISIIFRGLTLSHFGSGHWETVILHSIYLLLIPTILSAQNTENIWAGTSVNSDVELTAYMPPIHPSTAVIICPGGSYCWLAGKTEGEDVARALQAHGIATYVLKYRVSRTFAHVTHNRLFYRGNRYPDAFNDVQRALQLVRGHFPKARLGVIGFSAGGHLALLASMYNAPSFVAAIYPVVTMRNPYVHKRSRRGLLGEYRKNNRLMQDSLSIELHADRVQCRVFLVNCKDDPVVDYHNSVMLDSALTAAHKSHRYIQYPTGGHGFGMTKNNWFDEFISWINDGKIY